MALNVIGFEEPLAGDLRWILPEPLSSDINNLHPTDKKIILDKLQVMTNKYVHFQIACLRGKQYGMQAMELYENYLNQLILQLQAALLESKNRGEG